MRFGNLEIVTAAEERAAAECDEYGHAWDDGVCVVCGTVEPCPDCGLVGRCECDDR